MSEADLIRLIGHRWAKHSHQLKDFLGRNRVAFAWIDLDRGRQGQRILDELGMDEEALPVVTMPDGTALADPTLQELADHLDMHTHAERRYYDLAIVGGGPAGLAAAVYGSSEGLSTVLIEREAVGGQAGTSARIENYLGFPNGVSGGELAERALRQARRLGAEVLEPVAVNRLSIDNGFKELSLSGGDNVTSHGLIIATGVDYRPLAGPGLDRLSGAGVYYGAATTEASEAEGQHVYVVGSANSAGQAARYFSKFADRVTMIIRGERLGIHMSQYLIDQIEGTPNIDVIPRTHVAAAHGDTRLEAITLRDVESQTKETVPANLLFIFIGAEPRNPWLGDLLATDPHGYLLTGPDLADDDLANWTLDRQPFHLETSIPGIFAAGDIRHGSIRRVAGAVGEGSTSVQLVHRYLAHPG